MVGFELFKDGHVAPIVLDDGGVHGLKRMTGIFAKDIFRVTGESPQILSAIPKDEKNIIYIGVLSSKLVPVPEAKTLDGKRECFGVYLLDSKVNKGQKILAIIGSDKRGAIYGMFHLSEILGVSPWYYFADAIVMKKNQVVLSDDICMVSKEPSVSYRGFFINDEQPCFGNWAKEKFGSINPGPELYEKIFELLLRLKGNYIWPAMWRSDFTLDNIENAKLANEMGVIVGASHHEPCCRSGQEFQKLRHDNPKYGEDWSFLSNAEGITEFWKDGLIRNKDFENLITIGMRGENDSYLMPEDATLEDNINVLKSAITKQKELIKKYAPSEHPQLLALYKEVEEYYYGDENTKGLKDWEVLDNDIMMLCDDNFANVRTLPDDKLRKKSGGFGMYYHFDYFGEPVSYLWINSSPLSKVWEQMTMAYDYGVRAAWIVNVGDIKNQELPLSYFLDLAYDFDKWGTGAINKTGEYTANWLKNMGFTEEFSAEAASLITEYVGLNGKRRPEAVSRDTYNSSNENEATILLNRICDMQNKAEELYKEIKGDKLEECLFQLVYYPVNAVAEINKMHLYAGLNHRYITHNMLKANEYADLIQTSIKREQYLTDQYHTRNNGKWNHMQSVNHIGFRHWNDEQCQYPISEYYNPIRASRLVVSIKNQNDWTGANQWTRHVLHMPLCFETNNSNVIEVANAGECPLTYRIDWDEDWIEVRSLRDNSLIEKNTTFTTAVMDELLINVLKEKWNNKDSSMIRIYGIECETVADESENAGSIDMVQVQVDVDSLEEEALHSDCFVESEGCISIEASHYYKNNKGAVGQYKIIEDYGKIGSGIKAYPQNIRFEKDAKAPSAVYKVYAKDAGSYEAMIYTAPSNPVVYQGKMELGLTANEGQTQYVNTIPSVDYVPWKSMSWRKGVMDQIHICNCKLELNKGINYVTLSAVDPAVVVEKIVLWNPNADIRESYLGPAESLKFI